MTNPAQPQQVPGHVTPALGAEHNVVRIGAGSELAPFTRLPLVLETEPLEELGVPNTRVWFWVRRDRHHNQIFAICCQF